MKNVFTDHPHSVGESYFIHLKFAFMFGLNMLAASFACFVHAIFPFFFKKTGSSIVIRMMHKLIQSRPGIIEDIEKLNSVIEYRKANNK